jgi:hypothetical protein
MELSLKTKIVFIFLMLLLLCTCVKKTESYAAEITDLNGTWLPGWSYKAAIEEPEENSSYKTVPFSWGEGLRILHTSLTINAYRGDLEEPDYCWFIKLTFHFIDKDTIWIETDDFKGSSDYGKGKLWHRLSGPSQ